jgi:hypothetical protein
MSNRHNTEVTPRTYAGNDAPTSEPNLSDDQTPKSIKNDEPITEAQRNGSITGIGIVLGFSLTFSGQWSLGSGKWMPAQALAIGVYGVGILLQLLALLRVLPLPVVCHSQHKGAIKTFVIGITFVLIGFAAHILFDIILDLYLRPGP